MIAVTRDEESMERRFRVKLKKHAKNAQLKCLKLQSKPAASKNGQKKASAPKITTLGELVSIPQSDITHLFNNEAMLAISHAIEDLALEERKGELISTFQKLENFLPQKKRYNGLAQDLDAVRVWGQGLAPKGCPRIDFIPIFRPELLKYWIVLFSSPKVNAVLVCSQINKSKEFQNKIFAGFYSFNPFLVQSIQRQFNLMSCGLDCVVNQWEKDYRHTTPALKEVDRYFATTPC